MRLRYISSLVFICSVFLGQAASALEKPNIIIFYVDDLGWQDVQLNDIDDPCAYDTPNIVKLAASGMNITQGYSPAPTCAPSRAGILTGQHPAQTRQTHVDLGTLKKSRSDARLAPPYLEGQLDTSLLTLADAMNQNGYRTGHSGKWHVGLTADHYGFDVVNQSRGVHRGMDDRTKDFSTADDEKYPLSKEKYFPKTKKSPEGISYPYDEVTESALDFLEKNKQEPFFLNLCHWMVHWPMLTRNGELLEYYCDKMGQPFPPEAGEMTKPGQNNPYFAAMVTTVDWSLGRVVDYLEKTDDPRHPGKKLSETTYIFFTSDNGGAEIKGYEILSDNAPLKYGKKRAEEGGVRVPMVITGPSIKGGTKFDGLVNQLDYFPTILNLTKSTIAPENFSKLSGLDISPVLTSSSEEVLDADGNARDHLFWHFPHNADDTMKSGIRSGDFKLYIRYSTGEYELYQLYKDGERGDLEEANDLAKNPEFSSVVERLGSKLRSELEAVDAEGPYLSPDFKDKEIPNANIETAVIVSEGGEAKISFDNAGVAIKHASIIYRHALADTYKSKDGKTRTKLYERELEEKMDMRHPAVVSKDGFTVSAQVPEEIPAAVFMVVDENGYINYSKIFTINK